MAPLLSGRVLLIRSGLALRSGAPIAAAIVYCEQRDPRDRRLGRRDGLCFARVSAPVPYLHLAGQAREALEFYAEVFGGTAQLHTFSEFQRTDGPGESVAHGYLVDSPVSVYVADTGLGEEALSTKGLMFALLGTAEPEVLRSWFARLAEGGTVLDDLQRRAWGAHDGQVVDRYGLHWLVGFED